MTQLICRNMRALPELLFSAQPLSASTSSRHTLPQAKENADGDSAAANSQQQDAFPSKSLFLLQNLLKTKYSQEAAASEPPWLPSRPFPW